MAGTGQGLFVGVAVLGMVALGWAARAETIPLPTPAPLPKETGSPSKSGTAAQSGSSGLAAGVKSLFHLDREPETSATPVTTTTGFNAGQRAQVDKVSAYLSSIPQLVGNFVQVGPDGSRVRGEFYMQKPGKIRFEYEPPSRIEIIADGQSVVVRDRKLATQDLYPLSQTPLRFLLSDRIDLLRETNGQQQAARPQPVQDRLHPLYPVAISAVRKLLPRRLALDLIASDRQLPGDARFI